MYPCFDSSVTYGVAVQGLAVSGSLKISLEVRNSDHQDISEPNVRRWQRSIPLHGTVHITGMDSDSTYVLYRYNSTAMLPSEPPFEPTAERITEFQPGNYEWWYEDPKPFDSHSATYYLAARKSTSVRSQYISTSD